MKVFAKCLVVDSGFGSRSGFKENDMKVFFPNDGLQALDPDTDPFKKGMEVFAK